MHVPSTLRSRANLRAATSPDPIAGVPRWLALLLACSTACTSDAADAELGALTLDLTTRAGGITYQLTDARFALSGPEPRELAGGAERELSVSLPAGAYQLSLQEGYALTRRDGDGARVDARLLSQNPLPVQIEAGATTRAILRFELADGTTIPLGPGTLEVGIALDDAGTTTADAGAHADSAVTGAVTGIDAAASEPPTDAAHACRDGLRIDELDYEQASSDEAEFVELLNAGTCEAPLAGVLLELVNGTGPRVYARYDLGEAGASLAAGERLVVGDPEVLARLPDTLKRLPLRGTGLQNGPDAVRLVEAASGVDDATGLATTPVVDAAAPRSLDSVAYGGVVAGSGEGAPSEKDDGPPSLARCPSGHDSANNASDFHLTAPTPGAPSTCTNDAMRTPRGTRAPGAR